METIIIAIIEWFKNLGSNLKTQIIDWVKSHCNPKTIPAFLLEMGLKDGKLSYSEIVAEINYQAKKLALAYIERDNGIKNFIKLLKSAPAKKEGRVAKGGKFYINLSHFILSEELKKVLLAEFVLIMENSQRLAALIIAVEENFPELWNYNPGGKKQEFSSYLSVNKRFNKFLMLLDPNIHPIEESPNRDSTGAYSEYYFSSFYVYTDFKSTYPLVELGNKFKGDNYIHFRHGDGEDSMGETLSLEVLVAYGLDQAEIIYKNLLSSVALIEKSSAIGYKQRILNKFCHEKFNEVKENSAIMSFIEKLIEKFDPSYLLHYDMDVDTGIIAYIGGRQEYGNSGGTAIFSQIILWLNGQETMKEFQYRDRYSGSNDNYANEFGDVKIIAVKNNGEYFDVEVKATPSQKRFSSRTVTLQIKNEKPKSISLLNPEEQKTFSSFFTMVEENKMTEARKFHSNQTGTRMAKDYSGDAPYPEPQINTSVVKPEIGAGAFVIKECIDAMVTNMQWRYTLYLVKNQKVKEIYQDNAYEPVDASITGLEIFGDKLKYSTQNGRKEYQLP